MSQVVDETSLVRFGWGKNYVYFQDFDLISKPYDAKNEINKTLLNLNIVKILHGTPRGDLSRNQMNILIFAWISMGRPFMQSIICNVHPKLGLANLTQVGKDLKLRKTFLLII